MGLMSASLVMLILIWIAHFVFKKIRTVLKQISSVQGPPALPLIGNLHQFHFKPDGMYSNFLHIIVIWKIGFTHELITLKIVLWIDIPRAIRLLIKSNYTEPSRWYLSSVLSLHQREGIKFKIPNFDKWKRNSSPFPHCNFQK